MDLLDKYKKAWINQPEETDTFSALDIYKLAHSKSSSVVKWIFIIALLEFILWSSLNLFMPEDFYKIYRDLNLIHLQTEPTHVSPEPDAGAARGPGWPQYLRSR